MIEFPTKIEDSLSHVELATAHFDQWNLTVSLRMYRDSKVVGMTQITFVNVQGFRYLDEGDMLTFPFPKDATRHFLHEINSGGWRDQETAFGNSVSFDDASEYLVATQNECLSVLSNEPPVLIHG
jgi:hypothetical protein